MIRNAEIVDNAGVKHNEVALGKTVTFTEIGENDSETYKIVGSAEADPFNGKISNESPIAAALIGKKTGDEVIIPLPVGEMKVEIVKVSTK